MTHPDYIRAKAIELRVARRLTIDEIAERLALPRTTVYHWVRDLPIERRPGRAFQDEARRKGTVAMQRKYRLLREAAYDAGLEEWPVLSADPAFRDFVCLYLAEGYKRRRNTVSIANSDPAVLVLATRWLRRLSVRKLGFAVQYHADQDPAELQRFWADALDLEDPSLVRLQRKSNSNQLAGRTWRSVHGVLSVTVGDTLLRARLQAWMDSIRRSWA